MTPQKTPSKKSLERRCDPVCLIHGMEMSAHDCLYCGLCFKPLTVEQCAYLSDGKREDVCVECAIAERARIPFEFQKKSERIATLESKLKAAREALEPFAVCATHHWVRSLPDEGIVWNLGGTTHEPHRNEFIRAGYLRRASEALAALDENKTSEKKEGE